jgi:selenocysteine lyase/cysteine desulfurase
MMDPDNRQYSDVNANDWEEVRAQFDLDENQMHFAGFLLASHPRAVREAIDRHRKGLDNNPAHYMRQVDGAQRAREAAAAYLNGSSDYIALTDSTTMGVGLIYQGLHITNGQEILTTSHDHPVTFSATDWLSKKSGANLKRIELYDSARSASRSEITSRVQKSLTDKTRVIALTWVHSNSGLRIPIEDISRVVADHNRDRSDEERVILCLDGVHGFGVEDYDFEDLGVDFFIAGTHKWILGPRGTGIICGKEWAYNQLDPVIPSFSGTSTPGARFNPGGYHSFEHRWALEEAFQFHQRIGRKRIQERIHELSRQLKEGLTSLRGVDLITPTGDELSSGINCFLIEGWTPRAAVSHLRDQGVVASRSPYTPSYVRLAPSLVNNSEQVDRAVGIISRM